MSIFRTGRIAVPVRIVLSIDVLFAGLGSWFVDLVPCISLRRESNVDIFFLFPDIAVRRAYFMSLRRSVKESRMIYKMWMFEVGNGTIDESRALYALSDRCLR